MKGDARIGLKKIEKLSILILFVGRMVYDWESLWMSEWFARPYFRHPGDSFFVSKKQSIQKRLTWQETFVNYR